MTEADLDDDQKLAEYGRHLAATVRAALPSWVERSVEARHPGPLPEQVRAAVVAAAHAAAADVGDRLDQLLALDVDTQWTNPLSLIRGAVRYPTALLRDLNVAEVTRDEHAAAMYPDDVYDLTPGAFGDLGPDVHQAGLVWGAAKAHVHLRRHRPSGGD